MTRKRSIFIIILLVLLIISTDSLIVLGNSNYIEVPFDHNVDKKVRVNTGGFFDLITTPLVSSIFLIVGFIGLVIEALTPGFGLGFGISVVGFGLYFTGSIVMGDSGIVSLLLFITGLILIIIEAIVPGFGLPGIIGTVSMLGGIIMAANSTGTGIISTGLAIIIAVIMAAILIKLGFKSSFLEKTVLDSKTTKEDGFVSSKVDEDKYMGREGKTLTRLRPSGFVDIDGERLDVLSEEGFIESDTKIKIVKIEGSKIFVRRV